jgi:hypothetical protein
MAREREEELGLKSGAGSIAVEIGQERILGLVEHHGGVEARTEAIGQQRFSDACRPFDGDISKVEA